MSDRATAPLRIGTRGSALALAQAGIVRDALVAAGVPAELEVIVTEGDTRAPDTAWGEGAFVTAIERALVEGRVDAAVHSAKDVPTDEDPRLAIAAFLPRADPRDVLVLRRDPAAATDPAGNGDGVGDVATGLEDVPTGARVGTDSPRRTAFLRARRPDLAMHPLHGNVDTRLRRLDEGQTDVLVLAAAGLDRLGRAERIAVRLDPDIVPPAPGQGALAVQVRAADEATLRLVARLDDPATRRAVRAERTLLAASGGGCRAPLGALGRVDGGRLDLLAGYARLDDDLAVVVRGTSAGPDDAGLVDDLLGELAARAVAAVAARPAGRRRVLVTRATEQAATTMLALVDRGFLPVSVPAIAVEPADGVALDDAVARLEAFDWVVVTSANAARALARAAARTGVAVGPSGAGPRWAAVGRATERALEVLNVVPSVRPARSAAAALADALPLDGGERVLLPRSDLADDDLPARLRERGARVEAVVAYRTVEAPAASVPALAAALAGGPPDGVVLTSPSTVRGLLALADRLDAGPAVRALPAVCIGPGTAAAAAASGFTVLAEAPMQGPGGIADAAAGALPPSTEVTTR